MSALAGIIFIAQGDKARKVEETDLAITDDKKDSDSLLHAVQTTFELGPAVKVS